jgi:V/A-type H+-transporting ATPase subunit D
MALGSYVKSRLTLLRFRMSERLYKRVRKTIEDARNATIQKIRVIIPKLEETRKVVYEQLQQVSDALKLGIARAGIDEIAKLAELVPPTVEVEYEMREYEGIKFQSVKFVGMTAPNYSIVGVPPEFDTSMSLLYKTIDKLLELLNLENIFYMLLARAKEYQRMINAIDYVILPRLSDAIRNLKLALEEEEREEFVRRKVIQIILGG